MSLSDQRPAHARIGDYRLLARIGEGGMGVVHLAQRPDGVRVALKVLRPHVVGDEEARQRLAREVGSLRRIHSPRVAEILDADPHGDTPYVVTRYVPGLSLYHHVEEEGPVEGRDLLHFAETLAEALAAVHAVGVLHRDIKPTNVLMEGRSPVLIDFGLARVAEDPRLTHTGWLLGTPGYLAPEILYGDDASPASDVHAWAATVVFAATGRAPYGGGPAMAVMDRVRRGEHDLRGVAEPLRGLLAAGLSPEPLDRPSVPELRSWLREERERRHLATTTPGALAGAGTPESEPWTMPFAPEQRGVDRHGVPDTVVTPLPEGDAARPPATRPAEPATVPTPLEAPPLGVPAHHAEPYQAPPPLPGDTAGPDSHQVAHPSQATRSLQGDPRVDPQDRLVVPARPASRAQQVLQLLGLGALTGAAVAYAPYLGTAVVGVAVLLLRTASVTRQRHSRRRLVRGRPRWYDVPTTTLSTPGYVAIALVGTLADLALAALGGLGLLALGYLLGQSVPVSLLLGGLGFVPALWWGPGSARLRESVRGVTERTSRTEFGGWFVAAMAVLGAAVLVGLLLGSGANWAPAVSPPWR